MSADHAGGTIAHHGDLVLAKTFAEFFHEGINICRFLVRMGHMFWLNDRVFFFPHPAGLQPARILNAFAALKQGKSDLSFFFALPQLPNQHFHELSGIGMYGQIHVERGL